MRTKLYSVMDIPVHLDTEVNEYIIQLPPMPVRYILPMFKSKQEAEEFSQGRYTIITLDFSKLNDLNPNKRKSKNRKTRRATFEF